MQVTIVAITIYNRFVILIQQSVNQCFFKQHFCTEHRPAIIVDLSKHGKKTILQKLILLVYTLFVKRMKTVCEMMGRTAR